MAPISATIVVYPGFQTLDAVGMDEQSSVKYNYGYFPIFVDEKRFGISRDDLYNNLKENNIYGRRYFYPLISHFPTYRNLKSADPSNLQVAEKASKEVICLPIYSELTKTEIDLIIESVLNFSSNSSEFSA